MENDELWITRDGRRMLVSEMEESHVRGALRLMLRNKRRAARRIAMLKALESKRLDIIAKIDKEFWETETHERLGDDT